MLKSSKQRIICRHRRHDRDTGSSTVQLALLDVKVRHLSGHLKRHKKDQATRKTLLRVVGRRHRLKKYIKTNQHG